MKNLLPLLLLAIATIFTLSACSNDDPVEKLAVANLDNGYISSDLLKGTWRSGDENHYKLLIFSQPGTFTLIDYVDGKETGRSEAIYALGDEDTRIFKFSFDSIVLNDKWPNSMYLIWQNDQHTKFVLSNTSDGKDGTLYTKQ